jgi:hypothetical protein
MLSLLAGCDFAVGVVEEPISLAVPGRANAHVTLASGGARIAAAWAASGANGTDIYAAVSTDGARTFGAPVRVNDIEGDASVNGEQPPRVLIDGAAVDVLWVSKRDGVSGIRAAASTDGGRTFGPARSISPAGLTGARGWESAALGADGAVHAVWLDGRNAPSPSSGPRASAAQAASSPSNEPRAPGKHQHGDMRQDIYHAMWKGADAPIETLVAANVCFCCKTAVAARGGDVYVAWRHLFPGGVRDIAIAHSTDGGRTFLDPVRVSQDNWKIDACPDDGPAMAIDAQGAVRLAWPTLVTDADGPRMAIFESTSRDRGVTFSPRVRVDGAAGGPAHPRIAADGGASAIVWDELAQGTRRVMFRRPDASSGRAVSTGRIASYPAIAPLSGGFLVAWTDQSGEPSTIRAQLLR